MRILLFQRLSVVAPCCIKEASMRPSMLSPGSNYPAIRILLPRGTCRVAGWLVTPSYPE